MANQVTMNVIAKIYNDFDTKFGLPRQSGLVTDVTSVIVFEPPYRDEAAVRGLADYSHLWLLWHFSEAEREGWSPTVRPPRLGGNQRVGVFASRAPYRPNPLGLSSVALTGVDIGATDGPRLYVAGADLMNGTPILDIKPYLPFTDSHPDAAAGFSAEIAPYRLKVIFPPDLSAMIPAEKRAALHGVLAEDPRPGYHDDPTRRYGLTFAGFDIGFQVENSTLTVTDIQNINPQKKKPATK